MVAKGERDGGMGGKGEGEKEVQTSRYKIGKPRRCGVQHWENSNTVVIQEE